MDTKITGAIGAGVGALQTPLLRQFVDKAYPTTNLPFLKGFGTPSSLVGTVGGGLALTAGAIGTTKGKDGRPRLSDNIVVPAIDYGIVALVGGIFSGLYPAVTEADCVAKGGYFYDGVCHKTPAAALSMQNQPGVQTATSYTYKPPANTQAPAVDMNVLRQMSAEIQRLSAENQQLRTQTLPPDTVSSKQAEYGFMDPMRPLAPRAMFVPGQPTKAAREAGFMAPGIAPEHMFVPGQPTRTARGFGFMDGGSTPVAAVQQMKTKFDFSG